MSEVIVPERTAIAQAPTVAWTPLGENAILVRSTCDAIPAKVPVAVDGNPRNKVETMALTWRRPQADTTQASWPNPCRSAAIWGSATETIVWSMAPSSTTSISPAMMIRTCAGARNLGTALVEFVMCAGRGYQSTKRTLTLLPLTLPALSRRIASLAISRCTATKVVNSVTLILPICSRV